MEIDDSPLDNGLVTRIYGQTNWLMIAFAIVFCACISTGVQGLFIQRFTPSSFLSYNSADQSFYKWSLVEVVRGYLFLGLILGLCVSAVYCLVAKPWSRCLTRLFLFRLLAIILFLSGFSCLVGGVLFIYGYENGLHNELEGILRWLVPQNPYRTGGYMFSWKMGSLFTIGATAGLLLGWLLGLVYAIRATRLKPLLK